MGGVMMLPGCADAYSPKTVQSTMGSILRVKCMNAGEAELNGLKDLGYTVYGMTLEGTPLEHEDFNDSVIALVIGSESHGIGKLYSSMCDKFLGIRMPGKAESLNAAIAAGIAMHHIINK
jgi:TrmH family RNA methyltransferase